MILSSLPSTASLLSATTLIAIALLQPSSAVGQYTANLPGASARLEAAVLRDSALALQNSSDFPSQVEKMIRLHRRAAELSPADDPEASKSLILAAHLRLARSPLRAAEMLQKAGERAISIGDVHTAVWAYMDVATIAYQQAKRSPGRRDFWTAMAHNYAHKAILLANSPLLSEEDRDAVRNRIK